jgi:hypothetical protein
VYFWNLLAGILWTSLVTGRPPGISTEYIDCKIPTAEEEAMYQQGEFPLGFGVWGFQATVDCLLPLVEATLAAKSPSYETVLELDTKIRQAVNPPTPDSDPSDERTAISMRTFVRSHYQHLMLLYLHRGFFTQAMTEHPSNALLSPYRKSVVAAYQSACAVLDDTCIQFKRKPRLCARIWRIWSFAFSAAVIVGTVATRGGHLNLEPQAFEQFEAAYEVFHSAAEISYRAARALPVLHAMLQKAIEARKSQHSQLLVRMTKEEFPLDHPGTDYRSHPPLTVNDSANRHMYDHFQTTPSQHSRISTSFPLKDGFPAFSLNNHDAERTTPLPPASLPSQSSGRRDLSQSWGDLFNEGPVYPANHNVHEHKRGFSLNTSYTEGIMLHDRWASFMNYNILDERPNYSPLSSAPQ